MKTKKLLSLVLSVIMIMSVIPMYASAATQIALKATHVTEWPTAEGEIYFGQMVSEGITISGGKVVYEGVEIPGKFVHWNNEFRPTAASDVSKASITFVPDDSAAYKGFNKLLSTDVTYKVKKTTAVLKSENDIPQASSIKEGQTLSASKITGGEVLNPYRTDLDLSSIAWEWENPDLVVNESGEYTAVMPLNENCYEKLTMKVYVEVEKDIIGTIIEEKPSFSIEFGQNFVDGIISGGKATANGEEVSGTFDISDYWKNYKAESAGTFDIEIVFTPDDTEKYLPSTTTVTVTVDPIPISFGEDHKGTSIDDPFVYEVEPGTTVGGAFPKRYLNYPTPSVVGIEDANSYVENGRVYKVTVRNYTNTNYTGSEAYVKFVFKDVEFAASSASYAPSTEEIRVNFNSNKAPGTFDVYLDGKLIGDDVKLANDHIDVPYKLETSGKHTVKVVYNPTENDYYFMADYETEIRANVKRSILMENKSQKISVNGKETIIDSAYILNGDEISIKYGFEDLFVSWVITDASGKAVALDGVDLTSSEITFTMPDYDLVIAVKTTLDEEEKPDDGTDDDADNGIFGGIWSFFRKLINWFISIIKQMMSLFGLGA